MANNLTDHIRKNANKTGMLTRKEIEALTNGLLKRQHLANLDCNKKGIKNKITFGRTVVYAVDDVCNFIEKKYTKRM